MTELFYIWINPVINHSDFEIEMKENRPQVFIEILLALERSFHSSL